MRVPTRSDGTRSGVNWTRANEPPSTPAAVLIVSVFASPGTPSIRQVAAGEQADEHALEHRVLARDHAPDLEQRLLEPLLRRLRRGRRSVVRLRHHVSAPSVWSDGHTEADPTEFSLRTGSDATSLLAVSGGQSLGPGRTGRVEGTVPRTWPDQTWLLGAGSRTSAEQRLELGLDLGVEAVLLLLAPDRVLALAAEVGLDLLHVDAVGGRDVLLQRPDVSVELARR